MSNFTETTCRQLKSILINEYWLERELGHLRGTGFPELAAHVEKFVLALTAKPPNWDEAEERGWDIANEGYGTCGELESLRNGVIYALSPLLYQVPRTAAKLSVALSDPCSEGAYALAAARIIPIFSCEFCAH
jgi:hypothetical protein